jgi:hypothetical protein
MNIKFKGLQLVLVLLISAAVTSDPAYGQTQEQNSSAQSAAKRIRARANFASPEEAVSGLVEALRNNDRKKMREILGLAADRYLPARDTSTESADRIKFLAAYDEQSRIELSGESLARLNIGKDQWPFPFPLAKSGERWGFDTKAGEQELLDRHIGENELSAIQTALAYVDAQREYVLKDHDNDALPEYAQRMVSTEGTHDGLYWPSAEGEPVSPMGLAFANAKKPVRGVERMAGKPYHGYLFRILTAQGKYAQGGAMDYLVKGKLVGGFGLFAYPAYYRESGIKSFIVNHDGIVFSRDLGPDTESRATRITRFNPGPSWQKESP